MNTKVRNFYLFIFVLILFESIEQKQTFRSRETEANTRLLARVSGEIDAGNFSYYEVRKLYTCYLNYSLKLDHINELGIMEIILATRFQNTN